jgi:NAD-dependent dihydropyrimidine dehydrogenase PreA subunit
MDRSWLHSDISRQQALAGAWVAPEPSRCVQCGICSFHCPMDIDVRHSVWLGEPVRDSHCLTCGECIERCPRGLLRFEAIADDGEGARWTAAT